MSAWKGLILVGLLGLMAWLGYLVPELFRVPAAVDAEAAPPTVLGRLEVLESGGVGGDEGPGAGSVRPDPRALLAERNGRAIELLEEGELERAVELFEGCVEADPDEPTFARNLAEALARLAVRGHESEYPEDRELATAHLLRAVELDLEREDLAALLARWQKSAEAEKDFWRKLTDHFELSFDGTRDELMWGTTPLENELEAAYHEFGDLFGFYPVEDGRPRIRVVLYRRDDFDSVTGLGDWAGGVFDGVVRVPVEDLGREVHRLKTVLRHELVHAYVREAGGTRVPGWLNEGLAQWLEPPFLDGRQVGVNAAREKLEGRALFDLERLSDASLASWNDPVAIELAYAQSLALVAYLERQFGERVLFEMIAGCADGTDPSQTFHARTNDQLSAVLSDLADGL